MKKSNDFSPSAEPAVSFVEPLRTSSLEWTPTEHLISRIMKLHSRRRTVSLAGNAHLLRDEGTTATPAFAANLRYWTFAVGTLNQPFHFPLTPVGRCGTLLA